MKIHKRMIITHLGLDERSSKVLLRVGVITVAELLEHSEKDLLRKPGLGQVIVDNVNEKLDELGLSLKPIESEAVI